MSTANHRPTRQRVERDRVNPSTPATTCTLTADRSPLQVMATALLAAVLLLTTFAVPAHAAGATAVNPALGTIGADLARDAGLTGAGVQVAVVDTGIDTHPDLVDRIIARFDVSGQDFDGTFDGHGHGTFLAGLVAGGGADPVGVAPGVDLIDVRIADDEGRTSLQQVLNGLHALAATHDELGTDVVLLSLGADWPGSRDPLDAAIERLWDLGVVVVVPAGNEGPGEDTLSSPGRNATAVTVGAVDDAGTADPSDDSVPAWSSAGSDDGKPELIAPGVSLVSLRAPGSVIDSTFPDAREGEDRFRGTGTSMSAAITAGAAALLLEADPTLTPDAVKAKLTQGAAAAPDSAPASQVGAGVLNVPGALAATPDIGDASRTGRTGRSGAGAASAALSPQAWTWQAWTWQAWTWQAWTWQAWTWKAWTWHAWTWKAWTWHAWTWHAWTWR